MYAESAGIVFTVIARFHSWVNAIDQLRMREQRATLKQQVTAVTDTRVANFLRNGGQSPYSVPRWKIYISLHLQQDSPGIQQNAPTHMPP